MSNRIQVPDFAKAIPTLPLRCIFFSLLMASQPLFGQLTISYQNPSLLFVCDSAQFDVTIHNNGNSTAGNIAVQINFPIGISYAPGAVSGASENNISNLSQPVFSLADIPAGGSKSFSLYARATCAAVDAINAGQLFTNTILATSNSGNANATSNPYDVETPLLVITGIQSTFLSGSRGQVLTRQITIRNTRQGALTSFYFTDANQGGISISSPQGAPLPAGSDTFHILLSGADFTSIGDHDAFFEENESLVLTENILITSCGFDTTSTLSHLNVYWGCGNEVCQMSSLNALIQFLPNFLQPNLVVTPYSTAPVCFCGPDGIPQALKIKNTGQETATEISVYVRNIIVYPADTVAQPFGVLPNGFTLETNGAFSSIPALQSFPYLLNPPCVPQGLIYNQGLLIIPPIAPGDSVILHWNYFYCANDCSFNKEKIHWEYSYNYQKSCPPNPYFTSPFIPVDSEVPFTTSIVNIDSLSNDSTTYNRYYIHYSNLDTLNGTMTIHIELPCGFTWDGNNDMGIDGQQPAVNIVSTDTSEILTATYSLPLSVELDSFDFIVHSACLGVCIDSLPLGACRDSVFTSCPSGTCGGGGTVDGVSAIMNTYLNSCGNFPLTCGLQSCNSFGLNSQCDLTPPQPDSVCIDTIPGYALFRYELLRSNYGLPDNNNDRIADASGTIDLALIRTDRAMTGDTLNSVVQGVVRVDKPGTKFQFGQINLLFSANPISLENLALLTPEGLPQIDATLEVFDSSANTTYTCTGLSPNISVTDGIQYEYNITPAQLAALNCGIPAGFLFEHGDSVILRTRYHIVYNLKRQFNNLYTQLYCTPKVYLHNTPAVPVDSLFSCGCSSGFVRLSGYEYTMVPGNYAVPPCAPSEFTSGSIFKIELAEGNFFPYEFRNLGILQQWSMTLPDPFTLLQAQITYLGLQDGANLLTYQSLTPAVNGNTYLFNLASYQVPPIDEGFYFYFQQRFQSSCMIDGAYPLMLRAIFDFAPGLLPPQDPLDTTYTSNAIRALIPRLNLNSLISNITSFNNQALWDFKINNLPTVIASSNSGPALNCWLYASSASGLVQDFVLINSQTGLPFPVVNGVFQLGEIAASDTISYRLIATNNSCGEEPVEIRYGWNCTQYSDPVYAPCYEKTTQFSVITPSGEIEMVVQSPIGSTGLCDTVDYHTIEIFDAQLGAVYNVVIQVQLPQGMQILPGSCQLSYPAGSAFANVANPINLGNGLVQFSLNALNDSIALHGLSGIGSAPQNEAWLRFRALTDCDFIAGAYPLFYSSADKNCHEAANNLASAGDPVNISNVNAPYTTNISISPNGSFGCSETAAFTIQLSASGLTGLADSIFLSLPPGITYLPGSYQPLSNAPAGPPYPTGNELHWKLPAGLSPGSVIAFQITLSGISDLDCSAALFNARTVAPTQAQCTLSGQNCSILVQTGSILYQATLQRPSYDLSDFHINVQSNGSGPLDAQFSIDVTNNGSATSQPTYVDFYADLDENGILSSGDLLLYTYSYTNSIGSGQSITLNGGFMLSAGLLCQLIAVIDPAKHCACATDVASVLSPVTNQHTNLLQLCSGASQQLGVTPQNGHSYQWYPAGNLSCDTCSQTTFVFQNNSNQPANLPYNLFDNQNNGCLVIHQFTIGVQPVPGILFADTVVCAGESANLAASDGQLYSWQGPGITDPTQQFQTVTPGATALFTVLVSDFLGCTGADSALVVVYPLPMADAGPDLTFCQGANAQLQAAQMPGYSFFWSPGPPTIDNPTIPNPAVLTDSATTFLLHITDSHGCQSDDSIRVSFAQSPVVVASADVTVCSGGHTTLVASGASSYLWAPDNGLNCPACQSTDATPLTTTTYTVTGINLAGCIDQATVTVTVMDSTIFTSETLTKCAQELPVLLFGVEVDQPGTYCDTIAISTGCDSIHCITLLVKDSSVYTEARIICDGDFTYFEGDTLTAAGTYCKMYNGSNGCDSLRCLELSLLPKPDLQVTADTFVVRDSSVQLFVLPDNETYLWSPSLGLSCTQCSDPIATPDSTTIYSVVVTDENGCRSIAMIQVKVFNACSIRNLKIPSAITPNGDGLNDTFRIVAEEGLENITSMEIYNRWGQKVFSGSGIQSEWDARFNGQEVPSDVYVYIIKVRCTTGPEQVIAGDLTVIK